jgi:hypothetical protein
MQNIESLIFLERSFDKPPVTSGRKIFLQKSAAEK